jgi:hypothetical protein
LLQVSFKTGSSTKTSKVIQIEPYLELCGQVLGGNDVAETLRRAAYFAAKSFYVIAPIAAIITPIAPKKR